ncbi:MAG: hypothetical protein R3236_10565, partial [Phycisphaeraceae bacterium]|nr:hypothetical protein [Phycisphaeraceae bacterium]
SRQIDEAEADLDGAFAKQSVGSSGRFRWAAVLIGVLGAGLIVLMLRSGPKHLPGTIVDVAALDGAVWAADASAFGVGDQLKPASGLELLSGSLELRYHNGPRMVIEGPAKVLLESAGAAHLQYGKLSVEVPFEAVGFAVRTDAVEVVDLGTRFGVRVDEAGEAEVHVFDGEVATHSVRPPQGVTDRQSLSGTQAARFNRKGKLVRWIEPDYRAFALGGDPTFGIIGTTKAMQLLTDPPASLHPGDLESNDRIFLIPEKQGVLLKEPLTVTFDLRNRQAAGGSSRSRFGNHVARLPAGLRLDSYLLHFDPSAADESALGRVRFQRRIVGIIARGKHLAATDGLFGRAGMHYPSGEPKYRGLDDGRKNDAVEPKHDVLLIGPGARRIGGQFNVTADDIDQMRILVLSETE